MQNFILDTDALARGKEDALVPYPEREKDPNYWYRNGEVKPNTIYATARIVERYITIELFGMGTNKNLRGIYLGVGIAPLLPEKVVKVGTSLETDVSALLLHQLWSGGPYSFLKALVVIEETISKGTNRESQCWLRSYLLEGGIGTFPDKRMKYATLMDKFSDIFAR